MAANKCQGRVWERIQRSPLPISAEALRHKLMLKTNGYATNSYQVRSAVYHIGGTST